LHHPLGGFRLNEKVTTTNTKFITTMMKRLLLIGLTCLFVFKANAQCNGILLSSNKTEICAPGMIEFKVTGAPKGSAYQWDIGHGMINGVDTIFGFYQKAQKVDALVNITLPSGQKCSLAEKSIVDVHGAPVPSYNLSRDLLCHGPDTVQFHNTTPNSKQVSWVIDGTNYSNKGNDITHRYSTLGKKDMFLIIIDQKGCRGILNDIQVVDVRPKLKIDFTGNTINGCVPKTVQLKSTSSTLGEKIVGYRWEFEGQQIDSSSLQTPQKLFYDKSGNYGIMLEVTTDMGCAHVVHKKDYLKYGDTAILNLVLSDEQICLGEQVSLKTKRELPGSYFWTNEGATDTFVSSKSSLLLSYDIAGTYDIGLWYSHNGCVSQVKQKDKLEVNSVKADFVSKDNYHCKLPHTTHFDNQTQYTGSGKVKYEWTYYEHNTNNVIAQSNAKNDNHVNKKWGTYDVRLVATHENGCTDTVHRDKYVRIDSIRPAINARPRVACVDQTISFFNATLPSSYLSQDTFYWKFFKKDKKSIRRLARGSLVQHSYADTGLYDVMFYAGNTIGCQDSLFIENYVDIIIPEIDFKIEDPIVCTGELLRLEGQSKPNRAEFEYYWKLENIQNPSVVHESDSAIYKPSIKDIGEYKLTLVHHLAGGCKDTIVKKDLIKINGIVTSIMVDSLFGCDPTITKAKFNIVKNQHYGNPSNSLKYSWINAGGTKVKDGSVEEPTYTLFSFGGRNIFGSVTNSVGCRFTSVSPRIDLGVQAAMGHVDSKVCVGQTIGVKNTSNGATTHSKWSILPSNFKAKITPNDSGIDIDIEESGMFTIRLVSSRYNICSDTIEYQVEAQEVISDFIALDTNLFCAPVYAQFQIKSTGADSFFWSFGDGTTIASVDKNIANIYNKNSGWNDGYDIQLISKNRLGCTDTLVRNDFLHVLGPMPNFVMSNNYGCDPLEVNFIDKSKGVYTYLMDYRDGTTLDSNSVYKHTYRIENSGDRQSYRPALYAKDSLGCVAIFEPDDLVSVLRKPIIELNVPDPNGCVPHSLYFNHETTNTSNVNWVLNGQIVGDQKSGNHLIDSAGSYVLKLEVTNNNQCADSVSLPIEVFNSPKVEIITAKEPCLNRIVNFSALGDSLLKIEHYLWNFDDGQGTTNLHRLSKTSTSYGKPGDKKVTLTIVDENQCSYKAEKKINIPDPSNILFPMIKQVSVTEQNEIQIEWFEVEDTLMVYNRIYKDGFVDANGNPATFYEQKNNEQLTLVDPNVDVTTSNCYTMVNIDRCDYQSNSYAAHCPVVLNIEKTLPSKMKLTWSHYKGWLEVHAYDIYRSDNGGPYEKLISVEGFINEFEDQFLCIGEYKYYIVASFRDRRSRSNTVSGNPEFIGLKDRPFVKNVTVLDNGTIKINMNTVENPNWDAHVLSKFNSDKSRLLDVIETYDDIYIDENTDVTNESYVYELAEKDRCGAVTLPGFTGKSILIEGEYVDEKSILNWNSYEKWENGVESYHLQIRDQGQFIEVAQLAPSQLVYHDGDPHRRINDEHCYRVMAISRNVIPDTSFSNIVCTLGASKVWVPNAFTPNDDGKNDVFKPVGQFLKDFDDGSYRDYSMMIYSSWGQKLFETHDINAAWDGTYLGQLVVQDNYYYKIEISGVDEKVFRKKGSVILLK
jgi:gliding motility-associated-like protein